jgi:glycosyl transferase family 2
LSVVVPSVNGLDYLARTLRSLEAQRAEVDLEVVVVDRVGEPLRSEARRQFPWVNFVEVEPTATIPEMRHRAFVQARGRSIAVIEDHILVPSGWAGALLAAQSAETPVVGGSVDNAATTSWVDWAAFLCEYSHCYPPMASGKVDWLPGNNVVYSKELLDSHREVTASGAWENRLHDAIRQSGVPLVCRPEIIVAHKMHYSVGEYLSQRYLYARSYAGARVQGASMTKRLTYAAAALALPPLLFYRIVRRVLGKGRYRGELARSLPLLALFVVAWAAGEVVGYALGAGDSLSKVR